MESTKRVFQYWLPFLSYSLLIIFLSHRPQIEILPITPNDKILHFCEYFVYAFFLRRLLILYKIPSVLVWTMGLSIVWGITDELHQFFIPGRDCSIWDVLLDGIGAGTLCFLMRNRH